MKEMNYLALLTQWCDAMVALQVTEIESPRIHGGIMCPADMRIHGRSGDAMLPLVVMRALTGDEKYLKAAKRLFTWSENMVCPDNRYYNDTNSPWHGITIFANIQLGEILHHYKGLLDPETYEAWMARYRKSSEYLLANVEQIGGNINYPVTGTHAMALAYHVLGDPAYRERAEALETWAMAHFTPEGLLFGEGKPMDGISPKGCRPVDMGYNVEESLPALIQYALLMRKDDLVAKIIEYARAHLDFILPDGGLDNSFGTRSNKWTYWGSRTSDGLLSAFGMLSGHEPIFGEAVYRNASLMEACTHNGLLYGGPMYKSAGEPPCIHHTITHAKALAGLLMMGISPQHTMDLPSDTAQGLADYPSVHVKRAAVGPWRATFSDYDFVYTPAPDGHASGGSVSLLWHKEIGPLLTGGMERYFLVEPNNMQLPKYLDNLCTTTRIERQVDGRRYTSSADLAAEVSAQEKDGHILYNATGHLCGEGQEHLEGYTMAYDVGDAAFRITAQTEAGDAYFVLPVISASGLPVELAPKEAKIQSGQAVVTVKSDADMSIPAEYALPGGGIRRVFNPVGGFECVALHIPMEAGKSIGITIQVNKA